MPKIALIGAGSVVFAQKLVSDILQRKRIGTPEFRLMDINPERLRIAGIAAEKTAFALGSKATVRTTDDQREAIRDANYVICCVQVGDTADYSGYSWNRRHFSSPPHISSDDGTS